jgi:hypothetical protein
MSRRNTLLLVPLAMVSILGSGLPTSSITGQGSMQGKASPDVTWTKGFDNYERQNIVHLVLRNISKQNPSFYMQLGATWLSDTQDDRPPTGYGDTRPQIAFGDSAHDSDAAYPTDGELILDGMKRIYLTGSPLCKSLRCALPPLNDVTGYIINDLASASSIEGRVEGIPFALNEAQIAAIKDFCSRGLNYAVIDSGGASVKTVQDSVTSLNNQMRTRLNSDQFAPQLMGLNSESVAVKIKATTGGFQVYHVKLANIVVAQSNDIFCRDYTTTLQSCVDPPTKYLQDLFRGVQPTLAYIIYGLMFRSDQLNPMGPN